MIVYDRFWETLKERGITQYSLVKIIMSVRGSWGG